MKAKHLLISVALLCSLLFLYQGCGGSDGEAPKGSYPYKPPGNTTPGSGQPVTYHSSMELFLRFKEKVKNSEFNNKDIGNYSYRILPEKSCKTVLKIFTACYNSYNTWGGANMVTYSVTPNGVTNHPWGTLPAINVKLNEILGRVLDRISDDGAGINLSNYFVGVGDREFDVKDNDGTVYRISRSRPLGANPIMKLKSDGSGHILTFWPVPLTW